MLHVLHGKCSTEKPQLKAGQNQWAFRWPPGAYLCLHNGGSDQHIFFNCFFTVSIWNWVALLAHVQLSYHINAFLITTAAAAAGSFMLVVLQSIWRYSNSSKFKGIPSQALSSQRYGSKILPVCPWSTLRQSSMAISWMTSSIGSSSLKSSPRTSSSVVIFLTNYIFFEVRTHKLTLALIQ